jgi:hypothetical protein
MVNQSRIKATCNAPRYKFGYRIPRNYSEAMQFDLKNGNTLWQEATNLEMSQLAEYDTFRDLGHKYTASPPTGRTAEAFIVMSDTSQRQLEFFGMNPWEKPFGYIGTMDTVDKWEASYGDIGPLQNGPEPQASLPL